MLGGFWKEEEEIQLLGETRRACDQGEIADPPLETLGLGFQSRIVHADRSQIKREREGETKCRETKKKSKTRDEERRNPEAREEDS